MKNQSKVRIGAVLIAALFTALAFRTTEPCIISGKVIDKNTTEEIIGATVQLTQNGNQLQATTTDLNGDFCFTKIADGTYDITIKYIGFNTSVTKNVVVKDGKCNDLKIEIVMSKVELQAVEIIEQPVKNISTETMSSQMVTISGYKIAGGKSLKRQQYAATSRGAYNMAYDLAPAPTVPHYDLEDEPKEREKKPDDAVSNTEDYDRIIENEFQKPIDKALSTFSIDVDVASYGIMRKKIVQGQMPPKESVRLEELINYFTYDYTDPKDSKPFSVATEVGECPWNANHQLVKIGIQGKRMDKASLPPSNLVFLIDVSGSMQSPDKLPLVKESLKMLVKELNGKDKIAMAVYAGSAGLVLPSTFCNQKEKILEAIDRLEAGGSTAGAAGINLAYKVAHENFIENGNNRVILCSDGDFNVGVSSDAELTALIEKKREGGIFLSVLGFGMGNYKDSKMEKLADKGNGNYAYIDNEMEAKKNLVTQMGGTLLTIAKDVKIQVEFNPAKVKAYRLIGYENRALADKDFNDDKKDAGEIGAGASVTALYEIITDENDPGFKSIPKTDPLKYQKTEEKATTYGDELLTVKIRYKDPKESTSKLLEYPVKNEVLALSKTSDNFRFASAVAGFGMVLRDSKFAGNLTYDKVRELAVNAKGADKEGYRAEFIKLVGEAKGLKNIAQK